ncbi:MAG: hypothetical protein IJT25_00055 [Clostridia bacterium]|nr:hypothetical protein [Clostridia bacterium]
MKTKNIVAFISLVIFVLSCSIFMPKALQNQSDVAYAEIGTNMFEGPFFYTGMTTTTYRYFEEKANDNSNTSTKNTVNIDDTKTITVTEEQVLSYWLHTPINYNPEKSYPVIVYCSGSGCTIFEHENYATVRQITTSSEEFKNSPYSAYYRQSVYYGEQFWICGYKDINGNWVGSTTTPGNSGGGNAALLEQWYDLVYTQGKEEYDAFIIYIQPEDEAWWENHSNLNALCIHTMAQAKEICEEYSDEIVTYSGGNYSSGYIAKELSANVFSQLTVQLIDKLMQNYNINPQRQYLSGFSLGAMFSFDTICHYPDRFACAMFSGLPSSDITEDNAKNLTNMNIWTFNGSNDFCNKNFSIDFINKVNEAKENYGGTGTALSTICSGGHSGTYLTGSGTYVSGSNFTKDSTEIIDFMFNSVRGNVKTVKQMNNIKSVEKISIDAKISSSANLSTAYDIVFISTMPLGDYSSYGFALTTSEDITIGNRTQKLVSLGMSRNVNLILNGENVSINANEYNSAYIYTYILTKVPQNINSFAVRSFATSGSETYYSHSFNISVNLENNSTHVEVV